MPYQGIAIVTLIDEISKMERKEIPNLAVIPESDHQAHLEIPQSPPKTKLSNVTSHDSSTSNTSNFSRLFRGNKASFGLAAFFVFKVLFFDIFIPLGAVSSDFWQVYFTLCINVYGISIFFS